MVTSKSFLFFILLLLVIPFAKAQTTGKVIEQQNVKSAILKKDVHCTIYLPPDYETSNRNYPVVYLLHGFSDDNTGWLQFGEVNRYADKAIAEGTIPPMIIVMPNADSSWYVNSYDGKENYEDFFIKELMPFVEKTYRTKAEKRYRGITGLSMGGYGTLYLAFKHPDLFVAAAPLSAGIIMDTTLAAMPQGGYETVLGKVFGKGVSGNDRLGKLWQDHSILNLAQTMPADSLKKVAYWIDCGDDDFLTIGNCMLHIEFTQRGIPHEFRMRDGAHNWTYWRTGITDALHFIGERFRQY